MSNESKKNDKGFTLIELVIFIVISGIVVLGLVGALVSLVREGTPAANVAKANFLGQQKLEELTKNAFASITTPDNVTVNNYGGFSDYTVQYTAEYVNANNIDGAASGSATNYIRLTVQVTEPTAMTIYYKTIVTKRYYDAPQG